MLMKLLRPFSCLLLIISFTTAAYSQPVYQSADFATLNDSFLVSKISVLDIPSFNYAMTGADTVWDYSAFVPVSQKYTRFVDPDRTGFRSFYILTCSGLCYNDCYNTCVGSGQFPFICAGYCNVNCGSTCLNNWFSKFDLAQLSSDSINLGITTVEDIYNFYSHTQDALSQVAVGAKLSGFPIIMEYQNPDRVYAFPLEYGNTDTSYSNFALDIDSIPGTGIPIGLVYRHGQQRYSAVEGWGTLKTPFGVFNNVLKVKSEVYNEDTVIFQGDTIKLSDFLPAQVIPEKVIEYKWFSPDFGIPLLEVSAWVVNGNLIYQNLQYIDSLRCFQPTALFGYLPLPAVINDGEDSVEVNFYSLSVNGDSLYWNFDDDSSGANTAMGSNPSHRFTEGGVYNVEFVACNRACPDYICDTFSLPVLIIDLRQPDDTTSVAHLGSSGGEVYFFPNPFRDAVTMKVSGLPAGKIETAFFDLAGRKALGFTNDVNSAGTSIAEWNLSELSDGIYVVKVSCGTANAYCKLIKQR